MTEPGPGPGASQLPMPELWRTLGRPHSVALLRSHATMLTLEASAYFAPEYRDAVAAIILASGELADRIQQDYDQGERP